ncbi:MAG TPA: polysaccharide biosynthesis/export family protein [Tepidisphaeraceae bacterium]|jgi:protein involved in polysaccharide export with SLBB domain|nr:polysaccharide biosynthesis/export family protein [Tepidisphaeraceae bacterium]
MSHVQNRAAVKVADSNPASDAAPASRKRKPSQVGALLQTSIAITVAGMMVGCDSKGWFNPTDISVRSGQHPEAMVVPILSTVDPIEKGPADFATAMPPRPSDLVSDSRDYTIGRNDLLNISISDLMAPGQETVKVVRVSESGNISLPYLGSVHAAGLTEIELEQGIVQAYRDANLVMNAQVSVTVVEARGRTVEILGSVNGPGQYAILDSDFRLLDALVQAKDVTTPLIEYIYVIRRSESHKPIGSSTTRPVPNIRNGTGAPLNPIPGKNPTTGPTPDDLIPHSDAGGVAKPLARIPEPNHPLTLLADAPAARPLPSGLAPANDPAAEPTPAPAPTTPAPTPEHAPANHTFEFNGPESVGVDRIIKIPYPALKAGNLNYNIAIHPRDLIIVQPLPVGEYYLGGHVARPGVYTLSGRRVTIKEAITSGGGFDELAIPQRTEIIRRVSPDREIFVRVNLERIFAGETPDVYLKPNDQINVGTNALAPFLSAFRGAFRLTYGFGFLYDRNFAYSTQNGSNF